MPSPSRRPLTPRERECWRLLWRGYSNAGIVEELGISTGRARNLVCVTVRALGAGSRKEAGALYERECGMAALADEDATAGELLDRSLEVVGATLRDVGEQLRALDQALAYPRRYVAERRRDGA